MVRVLDASVVINLLAVETGLARALLRATPGTYVVTNKVRQHEVLFDPRDRTSPATEPFRRLAADELIREVSIAGVADEDFVNFAEDLGDGESATLAYAKHAHCIAVLDDAAALRAARRSGVQVEWTADLFLSSDAARVLGKDRCTSALYDALRFGRMRIPPARLDEVVELLGREWASQCPSIPRRCLY